jgi:DNA-nicking Smr family endonuclease
MIITGKGVDDEVFSTRGVLRKSVPNWLTHSEISPLILAYKNPSEALGGAGALYILLRKKG